MERRRQNGKKLRPKYITGEEQKAKKEQVEKIEQNRKQRKKQNKLVVKQRVAVVHELKLLGYHLHEIHRLVNEGGVSGNDEHMKWDVKMSTVEYYSRKANRIGSAIIEGDIKNHYEQAIKRWTMLIRKCHREGDNTNLVKATKELDELLGLRKTNINISGLLNVNDVTGLSNEDLDKAIADTERALAGELE